MKKPAAPLDPAAALMRELTDTRPRPERIVAVDERGKETEISMREGRGRWARVANAAVQLLAMGQRIEARDKDGAMQRVWNPDMYDDDVAAAQRLRPVAEEVKLDAGDDQRLELLARLEDAALARTLTALRPILQSYEGVVRMLTDRLSQSEQSTQKMVKAWTDAQIAKTEAEIAYLHSESEKQEAEAKAIEGNAHMETFAREAAAKLTGMDLPKGIFRQLVPTSDDDKQ